MADNLYSTKDFVTAVVLRIVGFPLVKMERENGITTFFFEREFPEKYVTIEEALKSYWDRELSLPVRGVLDTEKELKTRIHTLPMNKS